jgi:hypothetical protein
MDKVNKEVYGELIEIKCTLPSERLEKWLLEFNWDLPEVDWLDSMPRLNRCTTSTRLKAFGYRFAIC